MKSSGQGAARRVVRKRLADGTIKTYSYAKAPKDRKPKAPPVDSIGSLLQEYERSPEWKKLSERTKKLRLHAFKRLSSVEGLRVRDWRRRDIITIRNAIAMGSGNAAANDFVAAVSALLTYAVDIDWIEASPVTRIKALEIGTYPTWTEEDLAVALAKFREPIRRVVVLAIHTGQRRGDLIAMKWSDIAGNMLRFTQEKTGTPMVLPLHPALAAELAVWRVTRRSDAILEDWEGRPWKAGYLSQFMVDERRKAKMPEHLNLHGLRKLAAVRLAEAGCSTHEIAAWTGHKTLSEIERYTKAASQEKLAEAGLLKLSVAPKDNRDNSENYEANSVG